MKDYFAPPPPKPFDYAAYIEELGALISRGREMHGQRMSKGDVDFRMWKNEALALFDRIGALRYTVRCELANRTFSLLNPKGKEEQ